MKKLLNTLPILFLMVGCKPEYAKVNTSGPQKNFPNSSVNKEVEAIPLSDGSGHIFWSHNFRPKAQEFSTVDLLEMTDELYRLGQSKCQGKELCLKSSPEVQFANHVLQKVYFESDNAIDLHYEKTPYLSAMLGDKDLYKQVRESLDKLNKETNAKIEKSFANTNIGCSAEHATGKGKVESPVQTFRSTSKEIASKDFYKETAKAPTFCSKSHGGELVNLGHTMAIVGLQFVDLGKKLVQEKLHPEIFAEIHEGFLLPVNGLASRLIDFSEKVSVQSIEEGEMKLTQVLGYLDGLRVEFPTWIIEEFGDNPSSHQMAAEFEVKFQEIDTQLKLARDIDTRLSQVQSDENVLSLLIYLWQNLEPDMRDLAFKNAESLADVFRGRSDKKLEVLDQYEGGIFFKIGHLKAGIIRSAVLRGIRKKGIGTITSEINKSVSKYITGEINSQVSTIFIDNKVTLKEGLISNVTESLAETGRIMSAKLKELIYGDRESLPILAHNRLLVGMNERGYLYTVRSDRKEVRASGRLIGQEIKTLFEYLDANDGAQGLSAELMSEIIFCQINKLLVVGGFDQYAEMPVSSLLRPLENGSLEDSFNIASDLDKYSVNPLVVGVPSGIQLSKNLAVKQLPSASSATVRDQAELLGAFAKGISYFSDWNKNGFDRSIGKLEMEGQKFFPKTSFLELSMGLSSLILSNLEKGGMVVLREGKVIDGKKALDDIRPTDLMALKSIGANAETVSSADIGHFILAIQDWIKATEGIENTKSERLKKKNDDGKTSIDEVVAARKTLRQAVFMLGSFLRNKVQSGDGGIHAAYSFKSGKALNFDPQSGQFSEKGKRRLEDQLVFMQAMMAVEDLLDGGWVYRHAQEKTFVFMNEAFLSRSQAGLIIYEGSESPGLRPDLFVKTLSVLESFKPTSFKGNSLRAFNHQRQLFRHELNHLRVDSSL